MGVETAFEVGRLFGPLKVISDAFLASREEVFIGLPGIEGYYPMSSVSGSGAAINHTGAGGPLVQVGVVPVGYDGNSFRQLGGGTNYLVGTGIYGLTGTETFIDASIRGFTIGGWFMIDVTPTNTAGLISKSGLSPQLGYELKINTMNEVTCSMSGTGTGRVSANGPAVSLSEWLFLVGRFVPSSEVAVFVNGVKSLNVVSIPSAQIVSTQSFEVGRFIADDSRIADAKVRDMFICRSALTDQQIERVRALTAP